MSAELLGFPSGELGPAVISLVGAEPEITMKTLTLAGIRCSAMFSSPKRLFAKSIPCLLFAVALIVRSPLQTRADTIAFSTSGGLFGVNLDFDATFGYAFTLSSPVLVTNLGLFDAENNGLTASHAVTIWTSTGTQLVQATIPAGTGGTVVDGFHYVSIAPFLLPAGNYTIAGFYPFLNAIDPVLFDTSITSASGVSYAVRGANPLHSRFQLLTQSASGRTATSVQISNLPPQ